MGQMLHQQIYNVFYVTHLNLHQLLPLQQLELQPQQQPQHQSPQRYHHQPQMQIQIQMW